MTTVGLMDEDSKIYYVSDRIVIMDNEDGEPVLVIKKAIDSGTLKRVLEMCGFEEAYDLKQRDDGLFEQKLKAIKED